jgi:hypothetical protein
MSGWLHSRTAWALALGLVWLTPVRAQEQTAVRPDFSGTWALDSYLSDNPEQIAREIRIDTRQATDQDFFPVENGPEGPDGRGRSARGEGGVSSPGRDRRPPQSRDPIGQEDRKKLTELTDAVQFAPTDLSIAQRGSDLTITSARGGADSLHADGKTEKRSLRAGTVDRSTSWEGPTLTVAYEVGHAGTLTYRYRLLPSTGQLLIRVNFERPPGQPGPFDIKLVYNRAAHP